MKKTIKKLISFIFVITMMMATVAPVFAEEDYVEILRTEKEIQTILYPDVSAGPNLAFTKNKVSSLKNSNPSVGDLIHQEDYRGGYETWFDPKKAGKTTVSFKYQGKTYKTKITVKKYINPVKSITIGNKIISGSSKKSIYRLKSSDFANKKVKINISSKKGWKVNGIEYKGKRYKNGAKISIKKTGKNDYSNFITIWMASPKEVEVISIFFG